MSLPRWSVSEAKARFAEVIERSRASPQLIQKRGRAVAVVVSPEAGSKLDRLEAQEAPARRWSAFLRLCADLRAEGGGTLRASRRRPRRSPLRP